LPSLHSFPGSVYSQEALKAKLGTISQEAQNKLEEDTAKKEAKAEAKADAARKKKLVRS
jgi:density-regulated protein